MKDYQEALDEIKNMLNDMTQNENDSFKYHYYIKLGTIDLLQELVNEKLEQESRKEKLIVGSEWECVVNIFAPIKKFYIDPIFDKSFLMIDKSAKVEVISYGDYGVSVKCNEEHCRVSKESFLLCFKPIKEGE